LRHFFYLIEKHITIELQRKRRDLYFVHSAVLEYKGSALMIVAPSGTGKSTTTWGMLHEGFNYLSDELAPISLSDLNVLAYPRALCLKAAPPIYSLPKNTIRIGTSYHIPPAAMPCNFETKLHPLGIIFFLEFNPERRETTVERLSAAESAMHLYTNTLNALAHPGKGLDGAIAVCGKTPCYRLTSNRNLQEIIKAVSDMTNKTLF
jgi:hypothetical protein